MAASFHARAAWLAMAATRCLEVFVLQDCKAFFLAFPFDRAVTAHTSGYSDAPMAAGYNAFFFGTFRAARKSNIFEGYRAKTRVVSLLVLGNRGGCGGVSKLGPYRIMIIINQIIIRTCSMCRCQTSSRLVAVGGHRLPSHPKIAVCELQGRPLRNPLPNDMQAR